MAGQAEEAPNSEDDLIQFLADTSQEPAEEEDEETEAPLEDNAEDEESPADDEEESDEDEPDSENPKEQPSNRTYKVTVKGEDGADQQVEVPEPELIAGYQRHADYTRKAQELGNRERQAVEIVTQQREQDRNYFMQEAQKAHALVQQLAGFRSQQEMAQLAQNDPAMWAQERQRMELVQGAMQQLDQGIQQQRSQAHQYQSQRTAQAKAVAEQQLEAEGVKRDDVLRVFGSMEKKYGMSQEALGLVADARIFRMMRDAAAYQGLQAKKPTKTPQRIEAKPRMPAARQTVPATAKSKTLSRKFSSGRASVNDLASFIRQNNL